MGVRVWLPPGEAFETSPGYRYWSPDPAFGRFVVIDGADPDELLANEREHGDVELELDERERRGRRLRYVSTVRGQRHLNDVLFVDDVRAGYAVRDDAPESLKATFAEILERIEAA